MSGWRFTCRGEYQGAYGCAPDRTAGQVYAGSQAPGPRPPLAVARCEVAKQAAVARRRGGCRGRLLGRATQMDVTARYARLYGRGAAGLLVDGLGRGSTTAVMACHVTEQQRESVCGERGEWQKQKKKYSVRESLLVARTKDGVDTSYRPPSPRCSNGSQTGEKRKGRISPLNPQASTGESARCCIPVGREATLSLTHRYRV